MLVFEIHALRASIKLLFLINFSARLYLVCEKVPFDLFVLFQILLWEYEQTSLKKKRSLALGFVPSQNSQNIRCCLTQKPGLFASETFTDGHLQLSVDIWFYGLIILCFCSIKPNP